MGRGGREPLTREVQISKKISWLLRHGVEKEGLVLGPGGYVSLKDVLQNRNIRSFKLTLDEVRTIVAEDKKQRFSLILASDSIASASTAANEQTSSNPDPAAVPEVSKGPSTSEQSNTSEDYLIRANQGHSVAVDSEGLLTPITEADIPETVVHGTTHGAWPLIVSTGGMKTMGRNHMHFATGLPSGFKSISLSSDGQAPSNASSSEAAPVISGMRTSSSLLMFLDIRKAMEAGIKFWRSENGVILSEGDEHGVIGLQFFKAVEDRAGGEGVLLQDGKIIKEAPEAWAKKGAGGRGGRGGARGRGGRGSST